MTIGSVLFLIGAGLQAGAEHLGMLIAGRIMLGESPANYDMSIRKPLEIYCGCTMMCWTNELCMFKMLGNSGSTSYLVAFSIQAGFLWQALVWAWPISLSRCICQRLPRQRCAAASTISSRSDVLLFPTLSACNGVYMVTSVCRMHAYITCSEMIF